MIDVQGLLVEVSPEAPCGEDLEYDPAYGQLERATRGKPEQQFGSTIIPAEEPEWPDVARQALALCARTKDLRIAAQLTRALAHTQGWCGLRDGLAFATGLVERYWESVHPQLDPDDGNDPTLRINTLMTLCDASTVLDTLREAPLVAAQGIGTFSLRDHLIASKELPAPKGGKAPAAELQLIEAALQEADLDQLQATLSCIDESIRFASALETVLVERIGVDAAPDLSDLIELARSAHKILLAPLSTRGAPPAGAEVEGAASGEDAPIAPDHGKTLAEPTSMGAINNRADVIHALDLLIDYYRRQEPSSPIPLLLARAKGLVSKDFLEILEDLAPDGLSQAQVIRGRQPDE